MRATGIVRRLDDLGRLVIPKEICRMLGWKEGDPLELHFDRENKAIIYYHMLEELSRKSIRWLPPNQGGVYYTPKIFIIPRAFSIRSSASYH